MPSRILIIEDNPVNLELMTYLLTAFGHTVMTAGNGEDGLEAAARENPDIIICDIHLPKMDGYEVARRLRQSKTPTLQAMPLVAVTALAMVGDREKGIAAGFDSYIAKPIVPGTFVREVERVMLAKGGA